MAMRGPGRDMPLIGALSVAQRFIGDLVADTRGGYVNINAD